jgi:hypothetical protein
MESGSLQTASTAIQSWVAGSLPAFTKTSRRSPELRHQMAVVLSGLTPESAPRRKNAARTEVELRAERSRQQAAAQGSVRSGRVGDALRRRRSGGGVGQ